jgi:putative SOS response-associated peptidase YedK
MESERQNEATVCDRAEKSRPIRVLWENWEDPKTNDWLRTFAILTTKPNELVASLHDRMPVILAPENYDRWLGNDPDPADLIRPYPAEDMVTWPISTRVNKPENDDPAILDRVELSM